MAEESGSDKPQLSFSAEVGEGDVVKLAARSPHGETSLPLSAEQAALLGRALITASVATHAGTARPAPGTKVEDCQIPVLRWTASLSRHNSLPLVTVTIPGGLTLTLQIPTNAIVRCGESLVRLGQEGGPQAENQPEHAPKRVSPII